MAIKITGTHEYPSSCIYVVYNYNYAEW